MGTALTRPESPTYWVPQSILEAEMVEAMRCRAEQGTSMKSFNSIILKFPKVDASFRKCKAIFEEFEEDKNGVIDVGELRHSFGKLAVSFTEEEFIELFHACDINDDMGIKFNKFVVLLCLVYLLKGDPTSIHSAPNNKDGLVSKSEMVVAIDESTSGERSSGRIAMSRFEEMDWDRNGIVNSKDFLFAFTRRVGINEGEEAETA